MRATTRPRRKHFFIGERLRGAPFGSLTHALILIHGARPDESVCFPYHPKTAIRRLGERFAQLRFRGNFYLAKQLQNSDPISSSSPTFYYELLLVYSELPAFAETLRAGRRTPQLRTYFVFFTFLPFSSAGGGGDSLIIRTSSSLVKSTLGTSSAY